MTKIAALVILYNYDMRCIENIKSYINSVDIVFAFDNSTKKDMNYELLLLSMEKVCYIDGKGNQGLSRAINIVADKAIKMGYRWLITFDQDSLAHHNMIEQMREFIDSYPGINHIGLIGPSVNNSLIKFKEVKNSISFQNWIIQSGALHNLDAFKIIKGYDKNLFIDQVDIEYCIRLTMNGYKIVKLNHAILYHNTQDDGVQLINKGNKVLFVNKYSAMRYYYCIRNNLYCARKYKKINPQYCAELKRNIDVLIRTLPFEKDKLIKIKAVISGYIDFRQNKMGRTQRKF